MMICHCQAITDRDVHAAVDWMRRADPDTIITPGKVYRALGKRPECGGCLPLFLDTMAGNLNHRVPGTHPDTQPAVPLLPGRRQAQDANP